MATFAKSTGEKPAAISVLDQVIQFDRDGIAEVDNEDVAEILRQIPHEYMEILDGIDGAKKVPIRAIPPSKVEVS